MNAGKKKMQEKRHSEQTLVRLICYLNVLSIYLWFSGDTKNRTYALGQMQQKRSLL